jgi:hypothetical protein
MTTHAAERYTSAHDADVVVDVELARGLLFFVVENIGDAPAHAVRCVFSDAVHGLGGGTRIDQLRIFHALEFLGPRRRIPVLVDHAGLYFGRDEPRSLSLEVSWRTDDGRRRTRTIHHDLDAYRDLPHLEVHTDA